MINQTYTLLGDEYGQDDPSTPVFWETVGFLARQGKYLKREPLSQQDTQLLPVIKVRADESD